MGKYTMDWDKYAALARRAQAEGVVLLKNDARTLPIVKGESVSVFGVTQNYYYKSGTGSGGLVNTRYVMGILDALEASEDVQVNQELAQNYKAWTKEHPFDKGSGWGKEPWCQQEMPLTGEQVAKAREVSELAIVVIGRTAGEDQDSTAQKGGLFLTDEEERMLSLVCKEFQRTAVILNVGNIMDMKWVDTYKPEAVLYAWQGGQEGGNGVLDVLTGRVNPCGKLSDTIPYDITDNPSTKNFGNPDRDIYAEDLYVGYRYFETAAKERVMYPFGFGLSYTTFQLDNAGFENQKTDVSVSVKVTNTGDMVGSEVVQIYVSCPQGELGKPARALIDFGKTRELEPGEAQILTFVIDKSAMASYDDGGYTGHKSAYVLEAGKYRIFAGNSVRDTYLAGSFITEELEVVCQLKEAAAPVTPFRRMKAVLEEEASETYRMIEEDAPLRTINLLERIQNHMPSDEECVGDQGYKLEDVYDGKVDMKTFLAQLNNQELICLSRGEGMCSPKVTPGTASAFGGVTQSLERYGIPVACCADGPSGIRMDCGSYAFSMPNGTALACTFNTELVEQLYVMEGLELRKNRVDTLLGPGINIHRNPLNGRNFEYFSEDPLLTGKMAAAQLRGTGTYGVTGTVKHFAANNQEFHRRDLDSVVSERALREIYLKGYEIAVLEGGARSVMTSYGLVNGLHAASNFDLTTTILREEWGFEGMVMTDWWADMNDEGGPASTSNTAAMIRAQNDVYMVVDDALSNSMKDNSEEALREGRLTRGELLRNAGNILSVLMSYPVMERYLGILSQEELDAAEQEQEETPISFDMDYQKIGQEGCLDLAGLSTEKGQSTVFGLDIQEKGKYKLTFQMRADAGELAQLPVSVFINNILVGTITIQGTNGEWVTKEMEVGPFFGQHVYLKLFFAQSGMEIGELRYQLTEKVKGPF